MGCRVSFVKGGGGGGGRKSNVDDFGEAVYTIRCACTLYARGSEGLHPREKF